MSRSRDEIEAVVVDCVRHTLGFEEEEIHASQRLAADLGAESMDFVDIVGRVGRRLGVKLELQQLDETLRGVMNEAEFEQGLVTKAAVPVLRGYFPEADPGEIYEGMPIHEIPFLISVKTLIELAVEADRRGG